jgi:hypothetical protein
LRRFNAEGDAAFDRAKALSSVSRWSAFFVGKEKAMARSREKSATGKIFENILFLAEVFGDKGSDEIPNVPVLELARCFELNGADPKQAGRRRRKHGSRWQ